MFPERPIVEQSNDSVRLVGLALREPALQNFVLRRAERAEDGHIGRIAISRRERLTSGNLSFLLAFADSDEDEDGRGEFQFVDLESLGSLLSTDTTSTESIQDTGQLRFTTPPLDQTPVLAGFSFGRQGGGDHHLRELAVLPAASGYSVTFRDDSPRDDRFLASVNSVMVPNENIVSKHTKQFDDAIGSIDVRREPGQAVLCGFSFRYLDSDHHIRHLEVKLSGDRIRMVMRDNDRNRRFQATIEYTIIQQ